ncbi:MAG TPA: DNA recombination protein RmuC [Flavobacteriales bacterium]|nr:DNA recombination protein RmuC [Flavobacteriales bacterium]
MDILILIIGIAVGVVIGWLLAKVLKPSINSELDTNDTVSIDRFNDLQNRLNSVLEEKSKVDDEVIRLSSELSRWTERHEQMELRLKDQKGELGELQDKFKNDFKVLAQEILEKTGNTFKEQNKEQIGTILAPFKEKLESFEKKVEETYEKGKAETISLKSEVKMLSEQSAKLSKDAENLTKALKSDVKAQGNWGEVILERILEKSGLTKNQEYFIQNSITTEDGKRFQPDVIIKLPEDKNVIVDSKVSLIAYERFSSAENVEEQQGHLKEHIASIKAHVKGLSDKNYQSLYGIDGLDFVLLFIPIEGAFSAAVQYDNTLFQDAFDKNVVIVSTSTLLATLRTIASIWKQEKQTQNAIEIARQGGALYDKFVGLTEDLLNLGKQMDTAKKSYEGAMNKISSGSGNLIKRAEDLRKLGLKTSKQIEQKIIDKAGAED